MSKPSRILGAATVLALISKMTPLQVYDCYGPGAKYEMISLLGPSKCPDPKQDYQSPKMEVVHLLQQRDESYVTAHWCLVKRTTRVTRYGHDSITYRQHITAVIQIQLSKLQKYAETQAMIEHLHKAVRSASQITLSDQLQVQQMRTTMASALAPARQGQMPPVLHQYFQRALSWYHEEGYETYPDEHSAELDTEIRGGQVTVIARFFAIRPNNWSLYRIYALPRQCGGQTLQQHLDYHYMLVDYTHTYFTPMDTQEATMRRLGHCQPTHSTQRFTDEQCVAGLLV